MKEFIVTLVLSVLLLGLMDYDLYCVVLERGGWCAYMDTNYLWQIVVESYLLLHIFGGVLCWVMWIVRND